MRDLNEIELSGSQKTEVQKANKTIYQLLILMAVEYVISIGWLILQKVAIPVFFEKGGSTDWTKISLLYKYFGWTMDILSLIAILIFTVIIENKIARIFLLIFLGLKILFIINYRILEQQ